MIGLTNKKRLENFLKKFLTHWSKEEFVKAYRMTTVFYRQNHTPKHFEKNASKEFKKKFNNYLYYYLTQFSSLLLCPTRDYKISKDEDVRFQFDKVKIKFDKEEVWGKRGDKMRTINHWFKVEFAKDKEVVAKTEACVVTVIIKGQKTTVGVSPISIRNKFKNI